MQKALKLMNIQLPEVLSDVTGGTGMAILRAIVAGERRGAVFAKFRRPGCRRTEQDIIHALTGTWRDEHVFVLAQSWDLYETLAAWAPSGKQVWPLMPRCPGSWQPCRSGARWHMN